MRERRGLLLVREGRPVRERRSLLLVREGRQEDDLRFLPSGFWGRMISESHPDLLDADRPLDVDTEW